MNKHSGVKLIENIKSILLVVLLILTILLLFIFWGDKSPQKATEEDVGPQRAIGAKEILQPDRLEICFGDDSYTVTHGQFAALMDCFKTFSDSKNLLVEEITRASYEEIMKYPSMKAVFDYFLPFSALCEVYGIDKIPGSDAVYALGEIAYAAEYDNSLFLSDKNAMKYYRVAGTANDCFDTLRALINEAGKDKGKVAYFTLETFMGGEIKNGTLCPVLFESDIGNISYRKENFSDGSGDANDIIRNFFSDNFDFVRRIEEEQGTVIYMYGYGKIVVVAYNDGVLEFKMEDDEKNSAAQKYLEALEKATAFVVAHGAFETTAGTEFAPYIKEVALDPVGKKGFRFVFGIKINGEKIYYQTGAPMVVDVTNGKVSYFKRDFVNLDYGGLAGGKTREVFSAINLLAANNDGVKEVLKESAIIGTEDISFEDIVDMVGNFECAYVKSGEDDLTAAWVIRISGLEFYFGLDDGKLLGYYK